MRRGAFWGERVKGRQWAIGNRQWKTLFPWALLKLNLLKVENKAKKNASDENRRPVLTSETTKRKKL
jgi:hypothetical protein